jgi:hypothetical protein
MPAMQSLRLTLMYGSEAASPLGKASNNSQTTRQKKILIFQ